MWSGRLDLGFIPVNPNTAEIQASCDALRERYGARELNGERKDVMYEIFRPLVQDCDVLVFRALPDGSISSGAAREIEYAQEVGIPVIELPSSVKRRFLSLELTREYLREVGER